MADGRGGHKSRVPFEVQRIGQHQPHMAVNSRAGVPARRGLGGSVGAHGDDIGGVRAHIEVRGQVVAEAHVTQRAGSKRVAIDPHLAVLHHAVELDPYPLVPEGRRQHEALPIPSHAGGQERARAAGLVGLRKRSGNAPIVGHGKLPPAGIVELRLLGRGHIGLQEAPVRIEGLREAGIRSSHSQASRDHHLEQSHWISFSHTVVFIGAAEGFAKGEVVLPSHRLWGSMNSQQFRQILPKL